MVLGDLGAILGGLGAVFGRSWAVLGGLGVLLGRSWALLGRLWEVQNRSKNRSENRSEIEPDPDRPKTLWSYACNGFRGVGAPPGLKSNQPRKLSKPLSI